MDIIIAGGGVVGHTLVEELFEEGNNIVLIEKEEELLNKTLSKIDIDGLVGNAASYENLVEAGVENCDVFISVTSQDEINMIACIMAKNLGATYTIARVRNPEYADHADFMRQDLGISMMINPEYEAAQAISRITQFPSAYDVEFFEEGQVAMIKIRVPEDSFLTDMSLVEFRKTFKDILVTVIVRDGESIIPSGDNILQANDLIYVIGARSDINSFYIEAGYSNRPIKNALIIGGGRISYYLIGLLEKLHISVKVIEDDYQTAYKLAENHPNSLIIHGDGTDQEFLDEEHMTSFDSVICVRPYDEENILTSLYALSEGVEKVITQVSRVSLLRILGETELQTVITPKFTIADKIVRFVRSFANPSISDMEAVIRIEENDVEVLQFRVKEGSQITNNTIMKLDLKKHTLISLIVRDDKIIVPSGSDTIQTNDHIIIVTAHKRFDDIDDILEGREV